VLKFALQGQTVYAISGYDSGYKHETFKAKLANQGISGSDWYITQPRKGFAFHTKAFDQGYVDAFCAHSLPGIRSDVDEATCECPS
jgi:hypothetical protein